MEGGGIVSGRAKGSFEVSLAPQPPVEGVPNGRISIRKTFRGDLEGISVGEMLTSSDASNARAPMWPWNL